MMASSVAEVLLRIKAQGYETLDAVARDLADVEEQARRVERAQDDLGDSAGRVGSGAAKLAGALSLVGPASGEAARTLADLADVVEVGAEAVGALQVSWAGLATASAALGLALSPLILLWRDYAASQEQATAAAEAWARVQDASLPLVDRALTSVQALNIEVGGLTDAEKEQARIALEWDAALAQANETVREELNLARERLAQLGPSKAGYEDARRAVADLERQLTENADAAAKGMRADQLLAEVRRETAEANRTLEERERSLKAARADATSTTEDLAAQEAADLEAISAALDGWSASMGLVGSDTVLASQEVDAAVGDIKAALGEVEDAADAAGAAIARMSADAQGVNAGALLGNLGGAAQTLSTGSVGAMAEAWGPAIGTAIAGPVGAAVGEGVGQLLSGLEALGAAGGAEGVQAKLDESLTNIAAGIEALPTLVADVLPDLVTQLVANIVPALLELQARLFVELQLLPFRFVAGFIEGLDQWWSSVGGLQGLATAVWDGLTGWFSEAWATVRDFFRELFGFSDKDKDGKRGAREVADSIGDFGRNALDYILTGSYATGVESVPRTGVYKLHAGERVVPAHLREAGGGEGGSVHLHIQGFSIGTPDQLVRELNRALGDNGRRLAWRT